MGGVKTHREAAPAGDTRGDGPGSAREVEGELGGRGWACRIGDGNVGRQAEMAENALDDGRVFDRREEAEPAAAGAREDVDREDAAQQVGPRNRA
jgi:hypothetical protein